MSRFYLRIKPDSRPLYWAGDGWWTLRKDQAKAFASKEAAEDERSTAVAIEVSSAADDELDLPKAHCAG